MDQEHASTLGSIGRYLKRAIPLAVIALGLALTGVGSAGRARADAGRGTPNASIPFVVEEMFQNQPPPAPGGRCPLLTNNAQGTGISTPMGAVTEMVSFCVDPNGPNPLALSNGTYSFTNANGDTVFGSFSGSLRATPTSSTDNIYIGYGEASIEGGSGAFAGATGGFAFTLVYNVAAGDAGVSGDGVLALPDTAKP